MKMDKNKIEQYFLQTAFIYSTQSVAISCACVCVDILTSLFLPPHTSEWRFAAIEYKFYSFTTRIAKLISPSKCQPGFQLNE